MSALDYLDRHIIGQSKLRVELSILMDEIKHNNNLNILIRGSSGHGKTHIAKVICNYVGLKNCGIYLGNRALLFNSDLRVHVLDEAHEIKVPELLYPVMDSGKYTFIVLTNEYGELKEPFENRCIIFNLLPYTITEMATLIEKTSISNSFQLQFAYCLALATYSRGNPRVAIQLAKRVILLFKRVGRARDIPELKEYLKIYFNLDEGGFTDLDKQYIDLLRLNGTLGIDSLSRVLCIPKLTLQNEVEPFLIKKGLVRITSKGRTYIGEPE